MTKKKWKKSDTRWSDVDGGMAFIIPLSLLRHPNFIRLSANAVKLLIDLGRQFSGYNNGYLSAAFKVLSTCGWRSESTIREAVAECEHYRLIFKTRQGGKNKCNLYALTWRRIDEKEGKPLDVRPTLKPSDDWKGESEPYCVPSRKRKVFSSDRHQAQELAPNPVNNVFYVHPGAAHRVRMAGADVGVSGSQREFSVLLPSEGVAHGRPGKLAGV